MRSSHLGRLSSLSPLGGEYRISPVMETHSSSSSSSRRPTVTVTTCKPEDTSSTSHPPPLSCPPAQTSPSGLTDICQTSPSVINAAPSQHHSQVGTHSCIPHGVSGCLFPIQTSSYQTTPHDSLCQSVRPHPYGWSHSDHSVMCSTVSGVRERGKPRALSDMMGPTQTTMVKTIYIQNVGWAVQVGPTI